MANSLDSPPPSQQQHPYSKFIHPENQDILWGLFQKSKQLAGQNIASLESFFRQKTREYYISRIIPSEKPCSNVKELFEWNREVLAYLLESFETTISHTAMVPVPALSINVTDERKRMEDAQREKFANYSSEYHQWLARPGPKMTAIEPIVPNDEKIKNMDELIERQMQARKEDEMRIAALMQPPKNSGPHSVKNILKIDFQEEKSVSWDPIVEVVEI